jgi:hypothetical protein
MPQPLLFSPIALAREALYNPNWPMDAAQKLGVDLRFERVPPPYRYWLAKRAQSMPNIAPSTHTASLGEPAASPERQA